MSFFHEENVHTRLRVLLPTGLDVPLLVERLSRGLKFQLSIEVHGKNGFLSGLTEEEGQSLVALYNNTTWKGYRLSINPAQPDFMARLKSDWLLEESGVRPILLPTITKGDQALQSFATGIRQMRHKNGKVFSNIVTFPPPSPPAPPPPFN